MDLETLYRKKGELITLIEMAQAYIGEINKEIVKVKPKLDSKEELKKLVNGAAVNE
jgi:hypothetical protein